MMHYAGLWNYFMAETFLNITLVREVVLMIDSSLSYYTAGYHNLCVCLYLYFLLDAQHIFEKNS